MKRLLILSFLFVSFVSFGQVQFGPGQIESGATNITILNSNPLTGVPTAGSFVALALTNQSALTINVSGTYTGALSVQTSTDRGSTWITYSSALTLTLVTTGAQSATISSAAVGVWKMDVAGLTNVRITALATVTGTAVVNLKAVFNTSLVNLNDPIPAGTNSIGNLGTVTTLTGITNALPAGTNKIGTIQPVSSTTGGGLTIFKFGSGASVGGAATSTNATSVKASAGQIYSINATNVSASVIYLKLYNKASAPTVGTDTPVATIGVPAGGAIYVSGADIGVAFSTGIALATTGAAADADATAISAAGSLPMVILYQ